MLVTTADVQAARTLLEGVVRTTPLEGSRPLSDAVGGPVLLKCENLQRTGSFKIRGAYTRISRLTDDERARGVVAASAGNHAQGVALAARLVPAIRDLRVIRTWAGMNTTIDGASVIGRLPAAPRVAVALPGDAGYTLGPLVARMAVEAMAGSLPPEVAIRFSPDRFSA